MLLKSNRPKLLLNHLEGEAREDFSFLLKKRINRFAQENGGILMHSIKARILGMILLIAMMASVVSACGTKESTSSKITPPESTETQAIVVDELSYLGTNSFEEDADLVGWIGRGEGDVVDVSKSDVVSHSGTYSLLTQGRVLDWNGPGAAFPFVGGNTYTISVWVYQDSGSSKTMVLSAEAIVNGVAGYQNVYRTECASGEWVELSGTFRAGADAEKSVIYVETLNAAGMDFYIDDITVQEQESKALLTDLPSLKDAYVDSFPIGCAVPLSTFSDPELVEFLSNQYSTFTHENELKPENVLDLEASRALAEAGDETHPALNFDQAKPLLEFAKENGYTVNGHVLVWFSQTPDAFFKVGYNADGELVSKDVMLQRMENYIAGVFAYMSENYPGVVMSWDVVNEAMGDNGQLRPSRAEDPENGILWMDTIGAEYIPMAFEYARKYAPADVKLFYNDFSVPYEPKLSGIYDLVKPIAEAGNIDGVGFQAHYQMANPAPQQVITAMQRFADLGLRIRVTELDIEAADNGEEEMIKLAKRYKALMDAFVENDEMIDAVVIWGISDATSWKADKYPLLFDEEMQPKYAFWALTDPSKLPAETKFANSFGSVTPDDVNFAKATKYSFGDDFFRVLYDDDNFYIRVEVADATVDANDEVKVFIIDEIHTLNRSDATEVEGGYIADFSLPLIEKSKTLNDFDVLVMDAGVPSAWNDANNSGDVRLLGKLGKKAMPGAVTAVYGTPDMSGDELDAVWDDVEAATVDKALSSDAFEGGKVAVNFKTMWSEDNLYVLVEVTDPHLDDSSATNYEQDSAEIFFDENNDRSGEYGDDDGQYRVNFNNIFSADHGTAEVVTRTWITEDGFIAEFAIPFASATELGDVHGFDVRYNNITSGGRRQLMNFWDMTDSGWKDTAVFGLVVLGE